LLNPARTAPEVRDQAKAVALMNSRLYVGNLAFAATDKDLTDLFSQVGTVVEARVMMDKFTGRPRGFGFVTMSAAEEAEKAIALLDGKAFGGRELKVSEARQREDKGSR
jgi:RNA recognition motif-containing protein